MSVTTLALDTIAVDAGTQVWSAINDDVVADYAERLAEGVTFPPVVVFHDGSQFYLADGFHRVLASRRVGRDVIEAEVRTGTKTDALWHALGANRANRLRLTPADKQHAVRMALTVWPHRSQRKLAGQIGCSKTYVQNLKTQVVTGDHLTRRPRFDANRIVASMVFDAEHLTADTELIDYAELDRTRLREWIHDLEVARRSLGTFIRRLRRCHDDDETHGSDSPDRDRQDARPEGWHGATPVQ